MPGSLLAQWHCLSLRSKTAWVSRFLKNLFAPAASSSPRKPGSLLAQWQLPVATLQNR
jgi:hypothetical protein